MEIGRSIAKIRKENALTQENFAEKYNVTQQTISNWENGRSYPDLDTIVQISEDFDVSLDVLMKGDREMVREFSKKIKLEKNYRIIIIAMVGILVIALGIQAFLGIRYTNTINRLKSKFYNEVEKYGFLKDESKEDSIYYLETPDGVRYEVSDREMDSFYLGSSKRDLFVKVIDAFIYPDNTTIEANDGSETKKPYYIKLSYSGVYNGIDICGIDVIDGEVIDQDYINVDVNGHNQHLNSFMQQIYDDNKDQIEDTVKTLKIMWNDIYYPDK